MSVVSSILSSRPSPTGWRINVRLAALMDSITAIAFGLGLRFLVDTVGRYDFKLTGTLVGLWEGVIMLHFLKKMPKSSDPYIGFGVRLFIDFLFTESVARLVLVLIWTALGMVLADITPALWDEVGLKRTWRHLRRDLYTISQMVPTVAFFPPPRTVRFSPSREPSLIPEEAPTDALTNEPSIVDPSIITTEQTPVDPAPTTTAAREILRRRVPGHFPSGYSDTDTEIGSPRGGAARSERTRRRLSRYPEEFDTSSELSSANDANEDDLDDANRSSGSLSDNTERGEPTTAALDLDEVPDMVTEDPLLVDIGAATAAAKEPEEGELTPKQTAPPFYMPPTPSDSAMRVQRNRYIMEDSKIEPLPPPEHLPQIPDFLEEASTEDWEKIQREDLDADEKPPTPPAKDRPSTKGPPKQTPSPDNDMNGWDTLDSQFISRPPPPNTTNDNIHTQRQSQPPPYEQTYDDTNYDDIYDDPDPNSKTFDTTNLFGGDDDVDVDTNPWQPDAEAEAETRRKAQEAEAEAARLREEEKRRQKAAAEAEAARLKEEEDKRRKEEEEALKKKKAEEKAERLKKEADDTAARKKKREEEEEVEKLRKEAEKKKEEADEKARKEAEKKKKKEEEAAEKAKKEAEGKKRKEEEELARNKRLEEQEAVKKKLEEEAAEKARKEAAAAEEKRLKEETENKRLEVEEAARKQRIAEVEEAEWWRKDVEKKKLEEEAEQQKKDASAARRKKMAEEAKEGREAFEKKKEEDERKKKEEEQPKVVGRLRKDSEDRKKKEDDDRQKAEAEAERLRQEEKERQKAEADAEEEAEAEAQRKRKKEEPTQTTAEPPTTAPGEPQPEHQQPTEAETLGARSSSDLPPLPADADPYDPDAPHDPSPADELQASDPVAPTKAETVLSTASEPDANVKTRLGKMLLLRAQMVDVEARLEKLKADGADDSSPEFAQTERILRKYERQATKRYEQGAPLATYPGFDNNDDAIMLENSNDRISERKIEERIEQLLTPTSRSLHFSITVGRKQNDAKRQKSLVIQLLEEYSLFGYTSENNLNKKMTMVNVPEEKFATWLTNYRVLSTQPKPQEEGLTSVLWQ